MNNSYLLAKTLNLNLCDALRDLVPFVKFKTREKHPWRNVQIKAQIAQIVPIAQNITFIDCCNTS